MATKCKAVKMLISGARMGGGTWKEFLHPKGTWARKVWEPSMCIFCYRGRMIFSPQITQITEFPFNPLWPDIEISKMSYL